jgi:hypothetical protein
MTVDDEDERQRAAWLSTEELAAKLLTGKRWDELTPTAHILARRLESSGWIKPRDGDFVMLTVTSEQMAPTSRQFTFEFLLREADHYTYEVHGGECEESVRLPALGLLTGFLLNIFKFR